jgi:UDP-N-acetyl-2-amino-2-deoxyglucuronate dehydrogenase
MKNFALIGAAGYIAPRHMEAIHVTGNKLVAAVDPSDSVGIIDRYFPESAFFTEIERFDRHLEKLRHKDESKRVEYVSICSPNYLHDAHIRLALRVKAHAICEKPLALTPWNLDALRSVEEENGCKVYNILQLRVHDDIVKLKKKLQTDPPKEKAEVQLSSLIIILPVWRA